MTALSGDAQIKWLAQLVALSISERNLQVLTLLLSSLDVNWTTLAISQYRSIFVEAWQQTFYPDLHQGVQLQDLVVSDYLERSTIHTAQPDPASNWKVWILCQVYVGLQPAARLNLKRVVNQLAASGSSRSMLDSLDQDQERWSSIGRIIGSV